MSFLLTILYKYFLSYFQVRHCEHYIIHDIGIGNWNWSWNRNQNRKEENWKCSCEVQTNFMKKTLSKGTILTASTVSRFKNRLGCPRINILYICLISFHKQISNLLEFGIKNMWLNCSLFFLDLCSRSWKLFSIFCWEMHILFILGTWSQIIISTLVLFFLLLCFTLKLVKEWVMNSANLQICFL